MQNKTNTPMKSSRLNQKIKYGKYTVLWKSLLKKESEIERLNKRIDELVSELRAQKDKENENSN